MEYQWLKGQEQHQKGGKKEGVEKNREVQVPMTEGSGTMQERGEREEVSEKSRPAEVSRKRGRTQVHLQKRLQKQERGRREKERAEKN